MKADTSPGSLVDVPFPNLSSMAFIAVSMSSSVFVLYFSMLVPLGLGLMIMGLASESMICFC